LHFAAQFQPLPGEILKGIWLWKDQEDPETKIGKAHFVSNRLKKKQKSQVR
jgi:hypothetical protein